VRQAKVEPRGRRAGFPLGFTLVELMIVVAIVGILAAIAYPSYQAQVTKSRRAEGKALLLEVAQSLEKCKVLYGAYNNANCAAHGSVTGGNTRTSEGGFYVVDATATSATAFSLQAVPQRTDTVCGTLTITQAGAKGEGGTGTVTDCW
jgi:type IV pilus assembly protein PilE